MPKDALTPQARHHFTRFDQVDQLVSASEADPDVGFMARLMALCSLPRSNPGHRLQYKRTNGPYTLVIIAGGEVPKLPYSNLPRLLLAWVSTEAVRTQSPVLVLGNSLTEFMNKLGINSESAGRSGERTRLRNQMDRLFNSTVQFIYEPKAPGGASLGVKDTFNSPVARKTHLVWNPKKPNEPDERMPPASKTFGRLEAEQKRNAGDRWDRVAGRIESLIQQARTRLRGRDFER